MNEWSFISSAVVGVLIAAAIWWAAGAGPSEHAPETVAVDVWTEHGDLMRCYVLGEVPLFCERIDQPDD